MTGTPVSITPVSWCNSLRNTHSIEFLENQATVDEICWVSEVFDDIAAKTQSKDFIEALHRIHDKLPEEEGKLIEPSIKSAELAIQ
ncbi:hypothetical protein [Hallerella succinigenes]|uniref:hypothetical protein n=1 Tax=Hallerella succinigenes TaxID=1896222 RepID=UPI0018E26464|nr:hypothetical protein [Hallerella succinigenes]